MEQKVKQECGNVAKKEIVSTIPTITVSITTLHEDKPLVVQVPQGATVAQALAQAGVKQQEGWEVYVDNKLASYSTPLQSNCEMFYSTRVAGGNNYAA